MKAFEVNSIQMEEEFYQFPQKIYEGNSFWFAPLGSDIDLVFNRDKNSLYQTGDLKRWVVLDNWNNISGRIAAFYSEHEGEKKGGFGYFECNNNYESTECLLNTAFDWLRNNGCKTVEGPVNFGEKDRFWGLLTDGFNTPCIYLENYNPPYYEAHFKIYGLLEKEVINTYEVNLSQMPIARLESISNRLKMRGEMEFVSFSFNNPDKSVKDIHEIYSTSFVESNRLKLLNTEDIHNLLKLARPLLSDELIWLAYFKKEPIGFLAFMKDFNQIKKNNRKEISLKGFGIAVKPSFRNIAVELGLSYAFIDAIRKKKNFYTLYFTGINANTKAMVSFMKKLNASISKQHKTFQIKLNNYYGHKRKT